LVERGADVEVDTNHQHGSCREHGRAQIGQHIGRGHLLGGYLHGLQRIPRAFAILDLCEVALHTGHAELDDRLAGRAVTDHDHAGALPVTAARREPDVVEDAFEHLVGQRVVGESADRPGWAHDVV
jgi:hypothetical protein